MYYDVNGKRVEVEFKGYSKDSTVLSRNTKLQKQGSNKKNRARAKTMTNKQKQGKVGKASNRQGGPYTPNEMALWTNILDARGRKNHLAVFTNTETGNVKAFWQDKDGNLIKKVLDEPIPHFNDAKDIISNTFLRKK